MFFVGEYEATIDAKNRVSIPFGVRSKMNCDVDGRGFYVVPGRRPGTLTLYAERYFERLREQQPPADLLSPDAYEWRQFEYSQTHLLDPDNQGRVVLPDRLLKRAGIDREVTLIGVQDRLELWSRAAFNAFADEKWPNYPEHRQRAASEARELQSVAAHPPAELAPRGA